MMATRKGLISYLQKLSSRYAEYLRMEQQSTLIETGSWVLNMEEYSGPCSGIYGSGKVVRISIPNGDSIIWPMPVPGYSSSFTIHLDQPSLEITGLIEHVILSNSPYSTRISFYIKNWFDSEKWILIQEGTRYPISMLMRERPQSGPSLKKVSVDKSTESERRIYEYYGIC